MYTGFMPIFDARSETLILGSFPSVISREVGFYYGNKRNRFWGLMRRIYGEDFGESKEEKTEFLLKNRIALWDAVVSCDIKGSLDADIKVHASADLGIIFSVADIKRILCNGKKSYNLTVAAYGDLKAKIYYLPSTSPANANFDEGAWTDIFNRIKAGEI